ncbi:Protein translocase subunit SecA [Candidatus Cyrtobacter comes]|uniref:Protein translocase subunit SecA n=1 Tax=Candidatus Cyrtobacter comes TaxID=675776 RepID=A0ABU5L860_9RICK|nr:preprotein translocase subunit SecA [Candidatus Cyrtobacter comes]MDZ5762232.1 Protein translocase subunit SecA [Candidatus Cyrtobacter comes]
MLRTFFKGVFGNTSRKFLKNAKKVLQKVNDFENELIKLSDAELKAETAKLREQFFKSNDLKFILPRAFAVVREASKRVLNMRHFDVQILGGIALNEGNIAEMRTGEGKTLVATLAAYLNAIPGNGVHVVTVNDYLASRDAKWMGKVYEFLGLSVGCISNELSDVEKKNAYAADITYGTNNEFGFDYLRDNLKYNIDSMVQRELNFAIIDEVDSILIDEARTPLIISGAAEDRSKICKSVVAIINDFDNRDYDLDEGSRSITLNERGSEKAEQLLRSHNLMQSSSALYDRNNISVLHALNQALKAKFLFKKDVDYVVKNGKIVLIDEFTGRLMDGRRYSDGLHQAIEAKEHVAIHNENQTIASTTFQNYFRHYKKLSGMTGTAATEAEEFMDIYSLEVIEIPTFKPIERKDEDDQIYKTMQEKYDAALQEIKEAHAKQQPILVGTSSVEKSEYISKVLKKEKIKHNVLNALRHEQEALIISQAGILGAVTIATNMAGRGTDIMLGGNLEATLLQHPEEERELLRAKISNEIAENKKKVLEAGGLFIICTERNESRRIDNQLRGRSGRQGDVGRTKFFLSLEDDLMRIFGSEKISGLLTRLGLKNGEAITHPWITKSIEKAQKKIEARNYEIRKNLLKFDDVMNEQRNIVYSQRRSVMREQDPISRVKELMKHVCDKKVSDFANIKKNKELWDIDGLEKALSELFSEEIKLQEVIKNNTSYEQLKEYIINLAFDKMRNKIETYTSDPISEAVRRVFLISLDELWMDHLYNIDQLKNGIGLRAYAQKDPLMEYKIESYALFQKMIDDFESLVMYRSLRLRITHSFIDRVSDTQEGTLNPIFDQNPNLIRINKQIDLSKIKIPRNALCPCNSGKKYKYCHGAL